MTAYNKSFIPLLLAIVIIVAVVFIGVGGAYYYAQKAQLTLKVQQNSEHNNQQDIINHHQPIQTITPTAPPNQAAGGYLQGKATINQLVTSNCPKPTGNDQFGIKVYQGNTLASQLKFNSDGTFNVKLLPGMYAVYPDYYRPGTITLPDMWSGVLPKQVVITQGQTTVLNISTTYYCNAQ